MRYNIQQMFGGARVITCLHKHAGDSGPELDVRCGVGNKFTRAFC